jgi:hypothetical protein
VIVRIGIVGEPRDMQVQAVVVELERLGARVAMVPPSWMEGRKSFALIDGELLLEDETFGDVGAWWVNELPSSFVSPSEIADKTPVEVLERALERRERARVMYSWLSDLEDRGVPVVNPVRSGSSFLFKPHQLALLRRGGVPVPRTLYTSSLAAARAFRGEVGPCVVKPMSGGPVSRDFDELELEASFPPMVIQERVDGDPLQVTIVAGEIASAVVIDTDKRESSKKYREADLNEDGRRIAQIAASSLRLSYAGVELLRKDRAHVVVEVSAAPMFLDVERRLGHPISRRLAEHLVLVGRRGA